MKHVVVDPITRIEGHLRVEIQVDEATGKVTDAISSGTAWRGLELVMNDRDPRDAWAYIQRICGVCTSSHALGCLRAVEDAFGMSRPSGSHHPFLPSARPRLGQPARGAQGGSCSDGGTPEYGARDLPSPLSRPCGARDGGIPARRTRLESRVLCGDQGEGAEDRGERPARYFLRAVVGSPRLSDAAARGASDGDLPLP